MLGGRLPQPVLLDATPWPWPVPAAQPGLVACPMAGAGGASAAEAMYRLAYERAVASARPSRYALASLAPAN